MAWRTIAAALCVFLGWMGAATLIVPPVIASAYRNESYPFLNEIISGRDAHPLQYYLDVWAKTKWEIAVTLAVLAAGAAAYPGLRLVVDDFQFHGMRRGRVLVALAITACVVVGQVFDIVCFQEHWPFSNYPMYCGVLTRRETEVCRAYTVSSRNEETHSADLFHPFDPVRLHLFLSDHNERGTMSTAADALLKLARRGSASRDLAAVRIYRCRWQHDWGARNFDQPERTLLAESDRNVDPHK